MQILLEPAVSKSTIHEACGFHLMVTLKNCQTDILNDPTKLEKLVLEAATATGATVLQVCNQQFSPQGVTAVAILAESHASLHTYPENNTVFWDCFTCGTECKPELSVEVLTAALKPQSFSKEMIYRH
jgi:S-adenosylmethionine decarboxylase